MTMIVIMKVMTMMIMMIVMMMIMIMIGGYRYCERKEIKKRGKEVDIIEDHFANKCYLRKNNLPS